jgi:hypothetical protein
MADLLTWDDVVRLHLDRAKKGRRDQFDSTQFVLLMSTLQLAVPMLINELMSMPEQSMRTDTAQHWAKVAVDEVASYGDALQFGGKRGEAARVFNATAKGMAALALNPGGVLFNGVHWCVEHPTGLRTESIAGLECTQSGYEPVAPRPVRRPRPIVTATVGGAL